jgi:hypothetical protein
MKIRTGFLSRVRVSSRRIKNGFSRRTKINNTTNISAQSQFNKITNTTPQERELSTAMMLIQKARTIIQKALTVSDKIRNMAQTTLITGETSSQQIAQQLADINSSLAEYGVDVAPPSLPIKGAKEILSIKSEISEMLTMVRNGNVNSSDLDQVIRSLANKEKILNKQFDIAKNKLITIINQSLPDTTFPNSVNLNEIIVNSPQESLIAQGNINSDLVLKLIK